MIMQKASYEISREKAIWKSFLVYAWSQTNELVLLTLQSKKKGIIMNLQEILEVTNLIWLLTLHPSIIMKKTVGGLSLPSNILLQMSDIQADGGGNESLK